MLNDSELEELFELDEELRLADSELLEELKLRLADPEELEELEKLDEEPLDELELELSDSELLEELLVPPMYCVSFEVGGVKFEVYSARPFRTRTSSIQPLW